MNASRTLKFAALQNSTVYRQFGEVTGQILGMPYKLLPSVDGEIGRLLPDGNWTGMMGMLLNDTADLAIFLLPTEERRKFANFSFPLAFNEVTFVTQKPEIADRTFAFLHPFSGAVWLASILSLLLASLVFHRLLRGKYRFDEIMFNLFRNLLQQSSSIEASGRVQNLLHMTWVVGTMLLAYFYAAVLLSFLSFPALSGIKNIPELAAAVVKGTHRCQTFPGSFIPYELLKSEKESFKVIGQNLIDNAGSDYLLEALEQKGVVYIASENLLQYLRSHYFVSDNTFFHVTAAVAYGRKFCCAEELYIGILRASAAGLFLKIQSDQNLQSSLRILLKRTEETEAGQKLSLKDLSGVFLLLISGHVLAFIVLIFEIISHRILCVHLLRSRPKRKINKVNEKDITQNRRRSLKTAVKTLEGRKYDWISLRSVKRLH